jgi:hypothetical protein
MGKSSSPGQLVTTNSSEIRVLPLALLHNLQLTVWGTAAATLWPVGICESSVIRNISVVSVYCLPKTSNLFEFETGMYCELFLIY